MSKQLELRRRFFFIPGGSQPWASATPSALSVNPKQDAGRRGSKVTYIETVQSRDTVLPYGLLFGAFEKQGGTLV